MVFIVKGRYTALTDNNMGIINKYIVDEDSLKNLLLEILNPEYKSELIDIINRDKHVENDYAKNFLDILQSFELIELNPKWYFCYLNYKYHHIFPIHYQDVHV